MSAADGRPAPHASAYEIPVRYGDTDQMGVAYYANYLYWFEIARTEWLRARGIEQHGMRESEDLVMAVRSMQVEFEGAARLDDVLESRLWLTGRRGASFSLAQELWRGGQCLLRAGVKIACLHANAFRPRPLPPWLVAAIQAPTQPATTNQAHGDAPR